MDKDTSSKPNAPKIPVHEQIENTFKAVGEIRGVDCVPFIGITGAGKSTSINTLAGHQMKREKDEDYNELVKVKAGSKDLDGNSWSARIGHSFISETIYPKGYKISKLPFSYCDSPGLAENRKTCLLPTILGRSLLLALPRKISGMVIVIDFNTIHTGRGLLLKDTLKEAQDFFKGKPNKGEAREASVLYVFTHIPNHIPQSKAKEVIMSQLKKLLKNEQSKAESDQDTALVISCKTVLKYPENIFPIYPIGDKIHSKAAILKRLCQLKPINKRLLRDFNSQNEVSLIKAEVEPIVRSALSTFKKIEAAKNEKQRINSEMMRLQKNIRSLGNEKDRAEEQLENLLKEGKAANSKEQIGRLKRQKADWEEALSDFIEEKEREIYRIQKQVQKHRDEIERLDTNEDVAQTAKTWDEQVLFGEVLVHTIHVGKKSDVTINTSYPITRLDVDYTKENYGKYADKPEGYSKKAQGVLGEGHTVWLNKDNNKVWAEGFFKEVTAKEETIENGNKVYVAEYATPSHTYGKVVVTPYIASKHAYKDEIEERREKIEELEEDIESLREEISDQKSETKEQLENNEQAVKKWKSAVQSVKNSKKNFEDQIVKLERSINELKGKVSANKRQIKKQDQIIAEQKQLLNSKEKEYGMMRNFLMFVSFTVDAKKKEDQLFVSFKNQFDAYYSKWEPMCKPYKEGRYQRSRNNVKTDFETLFSKHQREDDFEEFKTDNENVPSPAPKFESEADSVSANELRGHLHQSQALKKDNTGKKRQTSMEPSKRYPVSSEALRNNIAQQQTSKPEVEQKQDGLEFMKRLWEEEEYEFELQRKGKILLIKLTNSEDLGKTQDVLAEQFTQLKEDLKVVFNKKLSLTVGKRKDVTIKPKFSAKTVEIHVKQTSSIDRLINLFVKEGLIEKDQEKSPKIECTIL